MQKRLVGVLVAGAFIFGACGDGKKGVKERSGESTLAMASEHEEDPVPSNEECVEGPKIDGVPEEGRVIEVGEGTVTITDVFFEEDENEDLEEVGFAWASTDVALCRIDVKGGPDTAIHEYACATSGVAYAPLNLENENRTWYQISNFTLYYCPINGEEPDTFCISGYKWYDVDNDGVVGSPEVPIGPVIGGDQGPVAGITITLTYPNPSTDPQAPAFVTDTTTTNAGGTFEFCELLPGDYLVGELLPPGWVNTSPEEGEFEVTIVNDDIENLGFGNVCYIDDVLQPSPEDCPIPD